MGWSLREISTCFAFDSSSWDESSLNTFLVSLAILCTLFLSFFVSLPFTVSSFWSTTSYASIILDKLEIWSATSVVRSLSSFCKLSCKFSNSVRSPLSFSLIWGDCSWSNFFCTSDKDFLISFKATSYLAERCFCWKITANSDFSSWVFALSNAFLIKETWFLPLRISLILGSYLEKFSLSIFLVIALSPSFSSKTNLLSSATAWSSTISVPYRPSLILSAVWIFLVSGLLILIYNKS